MCCSADWPRNSRGRPTGTLFFLFFFPVGLMALRRRLLTDRAALTSLGFVSRARLLLMQKTQLCKKKKEFISLFYFVYSILHPLACMLGQGQTDMSGYKAQFLGVKLIFQHQCCLSSQFKRLLNHKTSCIFKLPVLYMNLH